MQFGDTIAAIATPPGNGGVGIVRISGPEVIKIATGLGKPVLQPRQATYASFKDGKGGVIDSGLLIFFPGPNSFTGEDVLEVQAHGGRVVLDMILRRVVSLGARLALPGEFSQRAFLNDKIDLAQAEAIADLINSGTEQAARSAQQSMQGVFSAQVNELITRMIALRVFIEAAIDFVDEEIDFLSEGSVAEKIQGLLQQVLAIKATATQGRLLRDGMTVVLAGKPNAGKSSLLNALAGYDAAIVTDVAGTTRDVLRERIQIDGMPLHIIDTAGLRVTDNLVEQEGIRRAQLEMEKADRVLLLLDSTDPNSAEIADWVPAGIALSRIYNKIDLSAQSVAENLESDGTTSLYISVKTGQGLDVLREHLKRCVGFSQVDSGSVFIARRRHIAALDRAELALLDAAEQLEIGAPELVAEELRLAQSALAEITGEFTSDDLLGEIFSNFCIGK